MIPFRLSLLQIASVLQKWRSGDLTADAVQVLMQLTGLTTDAERWAASLQAPPRYSAFGHSNGWAQQLTHSSLAAAAGPGRDLSQESLTATGLVATSRMCDLIEFESTDGSRLEWTKLEHSSAVPWFTATPLPKPNVTLALFIPMGVNSQLLIWDHAVGMYYCLSA